MTTPRRVIPVIAAVLAVSSACSPYADPERWEPDTVVVGVPAIDWPLGAPDMSNEWVAAVYHAEAAYQAARNIHDFSSPTLRELFTERQLLLIATDARDFAAWDDVLVGFPQRDSTATVNTYARAAGPSPIKVLRTEIEGDSGTVWACQARAGAQEWTWQTHTTTPPTLDDVVDTKSGIGVWYDLERDETGTIRVTDFGTTFVRTREGRGTCDPSGIRPGFFDPQPPYGELVRARNFLGPDGTPIPSRTGFMHDGTYVGRPISP